MVQCGVAFVPIDISGAVPHFAAPSTTEAPLPAEQLDLITQALGLTPGRCQVNSPLVIFGEAPPFRDILERVSDFEAKVNGISPE